LIQHPGDEQALAGEKTHETSIAMWAEVSHEPAAMGCPGASVVTISPPKVAGKGGHAYNPPFAECRVGGSSSPFFLARRFQARCALTVTAR
jgi:hypothetical protein